MSQPERAPDSQRERMAQCLFDADPGRSVNFWAQLDMSGRRRYLAMADAMIVAREADGYEGIANDLVRELAAARERMAAQSKRLEDWAALLTRKDTVIEQAEAREGALRAALDKLSLAGEWVISCSERQSTIGATWPDLRDRIKHARGILTPTAGRSAPETCWLIERSIDDGFAMRPHWLAWRDRDAISWTPNAHEADRYEWSIAASREARMLAATLGVTCTAVEHQFSPTADQGAP